jgi:hypothetical protein
LLCCWCSFSDSEVHSPLKERNVSLARCLGCSYVYACRRHQVLQDARVRDSMSGNAYTMAPERLSTGLCPKSDVFSFGILFGAVILQYMRAGDSELETFDSYQCQWSVDQRLPMVTRAVARLNVAGAPPALGDILNRCIEISVSSAMP